MPCRGTAVSGFPQPNQPNQSIGLVPEDGCAYPRRVAARLGGAEGISSHYQLQSKRFPDAVKLNVIQLVCYVIL